MILNIRDPLYSKLALLPLLFPRMLFTWAAPLPINFQLTFHFPPPPSPPPPIPPSLHPVLTTVLHIFLPSQFNIYHEIFFSQSSVELLKLISISMEAGEARLQSTFLSDYEIFDSDSDIQSSNFCSSCQGNFPNNEAFKHHILYRRKLVYSNTYIYPDFFLLLETLDQILFMRLNSTLLTTFCCAPVLTVVFQQPALLT